MSCFGNIIRKKTKPRVLVDGRIYDLVLNKEYTNIHFNHMEVVLVDACGKDMSGRLRTNDRKKRKNSHGTYYKMADINKQIDLEETIQQIFGQIDPFKININHLKETGSYTEYKGHIFNKIRGYQH
jgi:hypothetical protein